MTRFYKISIGTDEKYYRTLKALINKHGLNYDNVYHRIRQGKLWIENNIIVSRKHFEESKFEES